MFMPNKTLLLILILALGACGKGPKTAPEAEAPAVIRVTQQDLVAISATQVSSGPVISGSLQAEKQADLRAEVSAVVVQVLKDNGDPVTQGDLLVRLDDTTFRQALTSAQEAERVAQQSFDQAERQFTRLKTLFNTGAVSIQAKEDAELRRNAAQSELAAARTRVVQEQQQVARTEVRAPFDGIVGGREVSNGDTAQVGKALLKIIDPTSIRFAGFIPSDQVGQIKVGQTVRFHINGQRDRLYQGQIQRINPIADPSTRQVGVQVAITDNQPFTVGLFAEGSVQTESKPGIALPESTLVREGDRTFVWRVHAGVLNKVEVQLGARDRLLGDYTITQGLSEGDQVLLYPVGALTEGAKVEMAPTPPAHAASQAMEG
jgi:membrane fusion protein, multidrug efflux system